MAQIASTATGCLYCQAHFGGIAELMDTPIEKVEALWEYQTSPLFSEAERAAFDFAIAAVQIPNAVSDEHFQQLKEHYTEDEIVELMGPLMHTAFLNRWNDTMGTQLKKLRLVLVRRIYKMPGGMQENTPDNKQHGQSLCLIQSRCRSVILEFSFQICNL